MDKSIDRLSKYRDGIPRLLVIFLTSYLANQVSVNHMEYYTSYRWIGHCYIGAIGAIVNVNVLQSYKLNVLVLIIAGIFILYDVNFKDLSMLIYLLKTFCGDFIAGKLDTKEWKTVLGFVIFITIPYITHTDICLQYFRIFFILFTIQFICEYGDNYLEHLVFFRHRYSYDAFAIVLLLVNFMGIITFTKYEMAVIQYDFLICLSYRISNYILIRWPSSTTSSATSTSNDSTSSHRTSRNNTTSISSDSPVGGRTFTAYLSTQLQMLLFYLMGLITGTKIVRVRQPTSAAAIMKSSVDKGRALEKYIASPAWLPLLSLESVDGPVWRSMRTHFDHLLVKLPPMKIFKDITSKHSQLVYQQCQRQGTVIDALVVAEFTLTVMLEYLFDVSWRSEFRFLIYAAWEWRKEIAVRGKGNLQLKQEAIAFFIEHLLKPSKLWAVFGEKWYDAEYHSLLLQPFIISPCINMGDIACAMHSYPQLEAEACIRLMHPFPIFERYVESDVFDHDGTLVVSGGTQVVMFTSDFNTVGSDPSSSSWSIFGSGIRSCAGAKYALILINSMRNDWVKAGEEQNTTRVVSNAIFQPEVGHKDSGRHNDNQPTTFSENVYFVSTIAKALYRSRQDSLLLRKK